MMLQHNDLVLFQKKLRTNGNQSLYFLWNNIKIMAFVTIMSTRWIQFKVFNFNSVLLLLQIGRRLFRSNNGTDDFLQNVLLSHRIVEMLYHSINNGGCGFLLLWFLFVHNFFWTKTGSSCCNIIHETGSCHFDMTHFFRSVLTYTNN